VILFPKYTSLVRYFLNLKYSLGFGAVGGVSAHRLWSVEKKKGEDCERRQSVATMPEFYGGPKISGHINLSIIIKN
jgi:hypothetical protein